MDLLAELTEARQRITILEGSISTLTDERNNHAATIASQGVEIANLTAGRDQLNVDLTTVRGELATAQTDLSAARVTITEREQRITQLESEASTAEQRVLERLGRGGNPPARKKVEGNSGEPSTAAEALQQYNAIADPKERAKFYSQHRDLIFPPKR